MYIRRDHMLPYSGKRRESLWNKTQNVAGHERNGLSSGALVRQHHAPGCTGPYLGPLSSAGQKETRSAYVSRVVVSSQISADIWSNRSWSCLSRVRSSSSSCRIRSSPTAFFEYHGCGMRVSSQVQVWVRNRTYCRFPFCVRLGFGYTRPGLEDAIVQSCDAVRRHTFRLLLQLGPESLHL